MAVGRLWDESLQRQFWRELMLKLDESAAIVDPKPSLIKIKKCSLPVIGNEFSG